MLRDFIEDFIDEVWAVFKEAFGFCLGLFSAMAAVAGIISAVGWVVWKVWIWFH